MSAIKTIEESLKFFRETEWWKDLGKKPGTIEPGADKQPAIFSGLPVANGWVGGGDSPIPEPGQEFVISPEFASGEAVLSPALTATDEAEKPAAGLGLALFVLAILFLLSPSKNKIPHKKGATRL